MNLICPSCKNNLIEEDSLTYCGNNLCQCKCIYYTFLFDSKHSLYFEYKSCAFEIKQDFISDKIYYNRIDQIIDITDYFYKPIKENESDIQYFFDTAFNFCKNYENNSLFL